jgi:hypothetical protein
MYTTKKLVKPEIVAGTNFPEAEPSEFSVYPNPAGNIIWVDPEPESSVLHIVNSTGVVEAVLDLAGGQDQVDLSFLPPGFYLFILQSGKKAPRYARVVLK